MVKLSKTELERFRHALTEVKPRQRLWEILKAELKRRGHWKHLPRGRHVKRVK